MAAQITSFPTEFPVRSLSLKDCLSLSHPGCTWTSILLCKYKDIILIMSELFNSVINLDPTHVFCERIAMTTTLSEMLFTKICDSKESHKNPKSAIKVILLRDKQTITRR